ERHVSSMGKARDAYREQFRIGDRSLLDVLDGEIELYRSRRTLVGARRDYATALYRLRASMVILVDHFAAEIPREAQPSMEYVRTH
ncbi:MAG: channel protein TolC, partial [Gammaproteobacteria bacterium]